MAINSGTLRKIKSAYVQNHSGNAGGIGHDCDFSDAARVDHSSFGGGPNGATPEGDLIADANGDLFGEAPPWRRGAGAEDSLTKNPPSAKPRGGRYMPTSQTLVSFTNANGFANGNDPQGGVTIDCRRPLRHNFWRGDVE